jgi:hypothetical protein
MAENDEAKDDMPELPSDYQAFRRSFRWLLLYGPWAFAALGLALRGHSGTWDQGDRACASAVPGSRL